MSLSPDSHVSPDQWEDIRDICGWSIGGMFVLIGVLLFLGGEPPPFAPVALGLGLSILPPIVDLIRMIVPYWRWTFVPTGAFLLGLAITFSPIFA